MTKHFQCHVKIKMLGGLFFGVLSAISLSADSSERNLRRGFLYGDYLRADGGRTAAFAGSFTVRNRVGFWARSGEIAAAAAARMQDISPERRVLDFAAKDADIIRHFREQAVAEGLAAGGLLVEELAYSATEDWRSEGIIRTFEFDIKSALGGRFAHAGLDVLGALREREDEAVAWQLRGYAGEDAQGGNAGVISRWESSAGHLWGVNSFVDYESEDGGEKFWRWSAGGEFRSPWADAFINYYESLINPAARGDSRLYSASGYDAEINVHSPDYPWLVGSAGYYFWGGRFGDADEEGLRAGVKILPRNLPLVLELEHESGGAGKNWGGQISYRYEFGKPSGGGIISERFRAQDWFYAPAKREYVQRIRTAKLRATENPVEIRVLSLSGGNAEYTYGGATLALTAGAVSESPLPQSYPAILRTFGGVISLSVSAPGAAGIVRVGSTVIFQPSGERTHPAMQLLDGNVRLEVVRFESQTDFWDIFTADGTVRAVENETTVFINYSPDKADGRTSVAVSGGRISIFAAAEEPREFSCAHQNDAIGGIVLRRACPIPLSLLLPPSAVVLTGAAPGEIVPAVASGGRPPYRYSLANAPSQLEISESGGVLSFNTAFNNVAVYTVTVAVEDADNVRAESSLILSVVDAPVLAITPSSVLVTALDAGFALATAAVAGGAGASYTYELTPPPGFPEILSLADGGGEISITAAFSQPGEHEFIISAESSEAALTATLRVRVVLPPILEISPSLVTTMVGTANPLGIFATATVLGGEGYTYHFELEKGVRVNAIGDLVAGRLFIDRNGGIIEDEPLVRPGLHTFTIVAYKSSFSISSVLSVVVEPPPSGIHIVLSSYSAILMPDAQPRILSTVQVFNGDIGSFTISSEGDDEITVSPSGGISGTFPSVGRFRRTILLQGAEDQHVLSFEAIVRPDKFAPILPLTLFTGVRATVRVNDPPGILGTVKASGGSGDYIYSIDYYDFPDNIIINRNSGEVIFNNPFLISGQQLGLVIIYDAADPAREGSNFLITVRILPALQPLSPPPRTNAAHGNTAPAAALANAHPQLEINNTVTAITEPPDNKPAEAVLILPVENTPVLKINPSTVTVTRERTGAVLAKAQASGGGYTFILKNNSAHAGAPFIKINGASGEISLISDFPRPGKYKFTVYARNKTGISAGRDFTAVIPANFAPSVNQN